jgi:hypothetical protein
MKGGFQLKVARSADEVFDFLADLRNESLWNPRVRRLTLATPGPISAGSVFRGSYQGLGALQTILTEYERPTRIAFRSEGPRASLAGEFTLHSDKDGVEANLAADVRPKGLLLSLLAPLLTVAFRRQNVAAATRLLAVLEHR